MTTTPKTNDSSNTRHRSRSRRSSRRRGRSGADVMEILRGRTTSRVIAVVMIIMAVAYVGNAYRTFSLALAAYGDAAVDGSYDETLYALGRPAKVRAVEGAGWTPYAGPGHDVAWQYRTPGDSNLLVHFQNGRVDSVTCTNVDAIIGSCPETFGVGVGQTEEAMITLLGQPASQRLTAQRKTVLYPELGLEMGLETYTIMQIRKVRPTRNAFLRFFRSIVP